MKNLADEWTRRLLVDADLRLSQPRCQTTRRA